MKKLLITLFSLLWAFHMQAEIKAVVFDFGGVVAVNDRKRVVDYLSKTFGPDELKDALTKWKGSLERGDDDRTFWQNYKQDLPQDFYEGFQEALSFNEIPQVIEVVKLLQAAGYKTPMLSNIELYQANVVKRFGYYSLFDPVLLSYEIGVQKPDPRAYQILLESLKLSPDDVLFIDDTKENIEAAQHLGIDAILFTDSLNLKEALSQRGIDL